MRENIDLDNLASLARIEVDQGKKEELAESIADILAYVESVEEVASKESDSQVGVVYNVLREDSDPHDPGAYRDALLRESPEVDDDGFVVVPPIL